MSNIKITQLPELAPTPLSGSDVFPVVSGNVTYQVTANAIADFAGGGANTGNVTFSDITIQGTGDEYGGSGLYLAPGANSTGNLQYLRVRGGDYPTHIHMDTGNNAYFDQYFGADDKFVKLEANGNIVINASDLVGNSKTWTMDITGNLNVPQGGYIGAAGVKGDGTMLTGGTGNIASLTSFYADAPGIYSSCLTAYPDGSLNIANYGNGTGLVGLWNFTGNIVNVLGNSAISILPATTGASGDNLSITAGAADQVTFNYNPGGSLNLTGGTGGFNDDGIGGAGGNVNITAGSPGEPGNVAGNVNITARNVNINNGVSSWAFDNLGYFKGGNLSILSGNGLATVASIIEDNGSLNVLSNGPGGTTQVGWLSDTSSGLGETAIMIFNEVGNTSNAVIRTGNTLADNYSWAYSNTGGLSLATVSSESAQFTGTRKIVGGALTGATAPYAVTLAAGGTPTVVYTSSTGVQSAKVTFVTQSNGSGFQWEQFDVVAVPSGDVPGAVNYVVSNRIKSTTTVPDTTVTATMNGAQIEITLTLSAAQTSGGWASFDATEFGLMVD